MRSTKMLVFFVVVFALMLGASWCFAAIDLIAAPIASRVQSIVWKVVQRSVNARRSASSMFAANFCWTSLAPGVNP